MGAAVEGGGDGALQAALARAAQADRDDCLASGVGLRGGGGPGAAAGQFQHGAQPPGPQGGQQPGRTHREQWQHAAAYRQPTLMLQGDGNAHEDATRFAARRWSVSAVTSLRACWTSMR